MEHGDEVRDGVGKEERNCGHMVLIYAKMFIFRATFENDVMYRRKIVSKTRYGSEFIDRRPSLQLHSCLTALCLSLTVNIVFINDTMHNSR